MTLIVINAAMVCKKTPVVARVLCQLRISVYLLVYLLYTKFYESAINSFGLNSVTSVAMAQFSRTSIFLFIMCSFPAGPHKISPCLRCIFWSQGLRNNFDIEEANICIKNFLQSFQRIRSVLCRI